MFTLSSSISSFVLISITGYVKLYLPKQSHNTLKTVNIHTLL
jgi:hypothetical protein